MDLGDVVGRTRHVVLDEVAPFEHGDLRGRGPDADRHEVATDRASLALAAPPLVEGLLVELGRGPADDGLDRRGRPATLATAATTVAAATGAAGALAPAAPTPPRPRLRPSGSATSPGRCRTPETCRSPCASVRCPIQRRRPRRHRPRPRGPDGCHRSWDASRAPVRRPRDPGACPRSADRGARGCGRRPCRDPVRHRRTRSRTRTRRRHRRCRASGCGHHATLGDAWRGSVPRPLRLRRPGRRRSPGCAGSMRVRPTSRSPQPETAGTPSPGSPERASPRQASPPRGSTEWGCSRPWGRACGWSLLMRRAPWVAPATARRAGPGAPASRRRW